MESRQLKPLTVSARLVAPDVRAPRGILRLHCSICCLFAMALSPVTAETTSIEPTYASLINEPMIDDARLEETEDEWRLQLDLKFTNEFLADSGIIPEFFDLPLNQSDKSPTLRVFFIRQRPNPKGNPDIFHPVTRRNIVVTSRASTLRTFVLLNSGAKFSKDGPTQRLGTIPVANAATADGGQPVRSMRGIDVTQKRYLPVLHNPSLRDVRQKGRGYVYTFEFDVIASPEALDRAVVVQVIEAPPTDPQSGGDTMNDWIFVHAARENGSDAQGADDAPEVAAAPQRFRYSREIIADYRRNLVIVNRLGDDRETIQQPFAVLKVR